jgi:hypothetical protein
MRHVVSGWWLYREFDTAIEADNYLRTWTVKTVQLCACLVGVVSFVVLVVAMSL